MATLNKHIADRIVRRMKLDGFADCTVDDVQKAWDDGDIPDRESLCSRILCEFDEYGISPNER